MAKIEIELSELESLRDELKSLRREKHDLEAKIKEINEDAYIQKAVSLSRRLFRDYMEATFKALGFDQKNNRGVEIESNLERWLNRNDWWSDERVEFQLSAYITQEYADAFLRIGIKRQEAKKQEQPKVNNPYTFDEQENKQ